MHFVTAFKICFLVIALAAFTNCKKDKDLPVFHVEHKLRSIKIPREASYNNANNSTRLFFYDGHKLSRILQVDSVFLGPDWFVSTTAQDYRYDAAGRLVGYYSAPYAHRFVYDAQNRLTHRILNGTSGVSDTIRFSYVDARIIATWRASKNLAVYYYFSKGFVHLFVVS